MKFRSRAQQAVCDSRLRDPYRFLAYVALSYGADDGSEVFPGVPRLARELNRKPRVVTEHWNKLVRSGIFKDHGRRLTGKPGAHRWVRAFALDWQALVALPEDLIAVDAKSQAAKEREKRPELKAKRKERADERRREAVLQRGEPALQFDVPLHNASSSPCTTVVAPPAQTGDLPLHNAGAAPCTTVVPSTLIEVPKTTEGCTESAATPRALPAPRDGRQIKSPSGSRFHRQCRPPCVAVCVSENTHELLRGRVGGAHPDRTLDEFYADVRARLDWNLSITGSSWSFWLAQFDARFGSGPRTRASSKTAGNVAAAAAFLERTGS